MRQAPRRSPRSSGARSTGFSSLDRPRVALVSVGRAPTSRWTPCDDGTIETGRSAVHVESLVRREEDLGFARSDVASGEALFPQAGRADDLELGDATAR